MPPLKQIIESDDTIWGQAFDLVIQGLIVISLIGFSLETIPGLSVEAEATLRVIEVIIVVIFTIEYFLRMLVADSKMKFAFSFYGLVDLAAIAPFYLFSGYDLRSIRSLRLLRLFQIFKLARYGEASSRLLTAIRLAREELVLFFYVTLILLFISAVGIYHFENPAQPEVFTSIFSSLWWAVVTLTTVGYGDAVPITIGGRVFTFFILMLGLGVIAVPTGVITASISRVRALENEREMSDSPPPSIM